MSVSPCKRDTVTPCPNCLDSERPMQRNGGRSHAVRTWCKEAKLATETMFYGGKKHMIQNNDFVFMREVETSE